VGRILDRPAAVNGELVVRPTLVLTVSFDHRVVDGAIGAAFGNVVMRYLQSPALLLLPEKTGG